MPRKIDDAATLAALEALVPTLELIAGTSPWGGLAHVKLDRLGPGLRIEVPMPDTNPTTIWAEKKWGSDWHVEVSGWSWKTDRPEHLRHTAAVLGIVATLAELLKKAVVYLPSA